MPCRPALLPGPSRGAGERGSGTLITAAATVVILALACLLLVVGVVARERAALEGAADLAAVAGGQAQRAGLAACPAATRSAEANRTEVDSCRVAGDEVEFVVSVTVTRQIGVGAWQRDLQAQAHAGVVTGAPG
ncbi:MAG: Rv3654c family TadE-like protein [Propioniciclava sp.]